jgi:hypothetical protein
MESSIEEVERGPPREERGRTREAQGRRRKKSVEDSTVRMDVNSQRRIAITNIPVRNAEKEGTGRRPALQRSIKGVMDGMRPRYLRYNIWDQNSDFLQAFQIGP